MDGKFTQAQVLAKIKEILIKRNDYQLLCLVRRLK